MENTKINYDDVKLEKEMKEKFLDILDRSENGNIATDEFEYKVYNNNLCNYNNIDEEAKWHIRCYIVTLRHIYGESKLVRDIDNTIEWFMRDHGNFEWGLKELDYKIYHENFFNYNNLNDISKWIIDRHIKKLYSK